MSGPRNILAFYVYITLAVHRTFITRAFTGGRALKIDSFPGERATEFRSGGVQQRSPRLISKEGTTYISYYVVLLNILLIVGTQGQTALHQLLEKEGLSKKKSK